MPLHQRCSFCLFPKARTRRLNSCLSRRNSLQNLQKNALRTTSDGSTSQNNLIPVLPRNSFPSKLPLPRYSAVGPLPNHSYPQSSCVNKTTCSEGNENITCCQTSSVGQSVACPVSPVNPLMTCASQVTVTPRSGESSVPPVLCDSHNHTNNKWSSTDSLFDLTNSNALCNDNNRSHSGGEHSDNQVSPTVIVIDEMTSEGQEAPNDLEQCSSSHSNQNELQLRSPKRKG